MPRKSNWIKRIALLVIIAFTSTSIAWSAPELPLLSAPFKSHSLKDLAGRIPAELGSLDQILNETAASPSSVIYIQDAHANPEAQKNIKKILQYLNDLNRTASNPVEFHVFTENTVGKLHAERMHLLPQYPQIETQVIDDLTERGELSGVELFALENDKAVTGVENQKLYEENLNQFKSILESRQSADQVLSALETRMKQKVLSDCGPKLKEFILLRTARHENRRELLSYLRSVSKFASKELQIDLSSASQQFDFPNLSRLIHLDASDSKFDLDAAASEWSQYLRDMSDNKKFQNKRALWNDLTAAFSKKTFSTLTYAPRWYFELLIASDPLFETHTQPYAHLRQALIFLVLQSEIGAVELFKELDRFEKMVQERLIATEHEREAVNAVSELHLTGKLIRGEITRQEWQFFKSTSAQTLQKMAPNEFSKASRLIEQAARFYDQAAAREESVVENMFAGVSQKSRSILVLVAGGFHSDGILNLLNRKNIPCALIAPKISQISDTNIYREVMVGKNTDFKLSTIFRPLILSDLGDPRVIGAAFERILRSRFPRVIADQLTNTIRSQLSVRSELRTPPPESASAIKVGVAGLDSTGIRFIEDLLKSGATVNGFDPDAAGFRDGEALLQKLVPQSRPDAVKMFPYDGKPEGPFTEKYRAMIEFVQASDVIIINMDPTKKKDPKDYEKDIYALVSNLAKATQRVRKEESNAEHKRKVFVFRSIVPFRGEPTALLQRLSNTFTIEGATDFEVIYQPTFLRRDPSSDEVNQEQVVLGTLNGEETEGTRILRMLYSHRKSSVTVTSARTAELSQYFTTLYLAKKISAFNQLTKLINKVGGDINAVALVAGLDNRLSTAYSKVGLGFSGWLRRITEVVLERVGLRKELASGVEALVLGELEQILKEIININEYQTDVLKSQIEKFEGQIYGKKAVLMGIASRPDSGRFLDSPVLDLIAWFKDRGVQQISIYDPHVDEDEFRKWFEGQRDVDPGYWSVGVEFVRTESDLYSQLEESHFAVVGIHHTEIANLDLNRLATGLDRNILYDGWNIYGLQPDGSKAKTLKDVEAAGINYVSMGRQPIGPRFSGTPLFESRLIQSLSEIPVPEPGKELKRIAVLGTGYVGLVQGTELAELGHHVTGADISAEKIEMLNRGESPIYEPGLDDLLKKHRGDRLHFTTDVKQAILDSQAIFIAVGTPSDTDGSIDLSYVVKAAHDVGEVIAARKQETASIPANERKIIIIKSTVTPDVFQKISTQLFLDFDLVLGEDYALASNPEFLREGQALKDVQFPDRIAFGVDPRMDSEAVRETERFLLEMIRPRMESLEREAVNGRKVPPVRVVITDTISAPLGKYLANSYLASDISFSNVAARAVKFLGGAWLRVSRIMRGDSRIAQGSFLGAGVGYGGSCFPKDVKALLSFLIRNGVPASFLTLVEDINHWVKEEAFVAQVVESILGESWNKEVFEKPLQGKQIGIWGLAFKPDTDDVREAPAFDIILGLLNAGAKVAAHDPLPKAVSNFVGDIQKSDSVKDDKKREMLQALKRYLEAGQLVIVRDRNDAARGSDALALLTEWRDYAPKSDQNPNGIDFAELKSLLSEGGRSPIVIAGRDLWSGKEVAAAGISFFAVSQRDRMSSARSELRSASTRKTKRWFKRHKLFAFSLVSVVTLGSWMGYEYWKLSQNPNLQAIAAIQKAHGVNLQSRHIPIQFKDTAGSGLLDNPFIQDSISDALYHIKAVDGGYYGEIAAIEIMRNENDKSKEQFPYVLRLKDLKFMHGFEKDFEGQAYLRGAKETLFSDAQNIQALILKGEYDDFITKKETLPKLLVVLTVSVVLLLVAGVIGEAFQIMRRNRIFERHSEARRANDADLRRWAIRRSGQTPPDEKRSELRSLKPRSPLVSGLRALFFIGVAAVLTVIVLVASPFLLALSLWLRATRKNTHIKQTALESRAPDEVDDVDVSRSELRSQRALTKFSQLAKGHYVHHNDHGVGIIEEKSGQLIRVRFRTKNGGGYFIKSFTNASFAQFRWATEGEIGTFQEPLDSKPTAPEPNRGVKEQDQKKLLYINQILSKNRALAIPHRIPLGSALQGEIKLFGGAESSSLNGLYQSAQRLEEILSARERREFNWNTANDLERAVILEILELSVTVHPSVANSTFHKHLLANQTAVEAALDSDGKLKGEIKERAQKRIENVRRFRQIAKGELDQFIEEAFVNVGIILQNFLKESSPQLPRAESFETVFSQDVRSELRIVQAVTRWSHGFLPVSAFLRRHHPRLNAANILDRSAWADESPKIASLSAQVIQVADGSNGLDASIFDKSLEALLRTNTRLVLLVTNTDNESVKEFNRVLSNRLTSVSKELQLKTGNVSGQLIVQKVDRSLRELATYVTKQYLSVQLREKTAVVAQDSAFLRKVRSGLLFLNDLNDLARQDEALLAVIGAANNPQSVENRFGIIDLSAWLDSKLTQDRESGRKVSVSA